MTGRPGLLRGALLGLLLLGATEARADAPVVPGGTRVDGVVAVVGGAAPGPGVHVILRSDVELRARIALSAGQQRAFLGPLPAEALRQALEELIGEVLIAREAERVRIASADAAEVGRQRRALEQAAGGASRLAEIMRRHNIPDSEIEAIARQRALVGAFLEANLAGATSISEAEIEEAFAAGDHPFIGHELEEVREPMRVWLGRRALDRAVRRWVGVLRSRTPVRVLASFE